MSAMSETSSTLQFANTVKKAIFDRPTVLNQAARKYVNLEEHQAVLEELQREKKARKELEQLINMESPLSTKHSQQTIDLVRDNNCLR